jgi:hypothetical protein
MCGAKLCGELDGLADGLVDGLLVAGVLPELTGAILLSGGAFGALILK